MPILAVILLVAVYLISAISEGIFLNKLMEGFIGAAWLAYGISGAIQATRALLVFFPQLNPNRPTFGYQGEAIAVVMGLVAIGSVWGVVTAVGLPHPVGISLSILMLAGMGVEIFFLREIRYATELELFANKEHWGEIREYHQARAELRAFLDEVKDYEAPTVSNQLPTGQGQPANSHTLFSDKVLHAIGQAYLLNFNQMDTIQDLLQSGVAEKDVIAIINSYSLENRYTEHSDARDAKHFHNAGLPITDTQMDAVMLDLLAGHQPEKPFTKEQRIQIVKEASNRGLNVDHSLSFVGPLEISSMSPNGKH